MKHDTREAWLTAGIGHIRPLFAEAGYTIPDNVKVACGFTSSGIKGRKSIPIGECWSDSASAGKVFETFISPLIAEPVEVLAVVVHENVHATVGLAAKHGKLFKRCATAVGLEGKMKSTHAGEALKARLVQIAGDLGPYPHAELKGLTTGKKKQTTRLKKCECPECGYTVRVTDKWLEFGPPLCPNDTCGERGEPLHLDGADD